MLRRKHERKVGALGAFSLVILLTAGCGGGSGMQSNSGNNTAIAPLSVAMALQIAYNGAAGTTQQAMAQTLRLGDLSVPQLNGGNAALQASLLDPDPKVDLTIANSLWVHLSAHPVAPTVVSTDQKGQWASEFPLAQTAPGPFALADGTQTSVPMMRQVAVMPYFHGASFQAVTLPYGQGRLNMLNLSGIYPGAFISDVEHKTVVEVNETGTVAAGATSVGISISAMQYPVNLTVSNPFCYAIRDNTTGDLLFVDVLMNPGAG